MSESTPSNTSSPYPHQDGENTPDYIKNSKFTSEIYKIEIKNMPKKVGFSEMKEYLVRKNVKAHKVKLI